MVPAPTRHNLIAASGQGEGGDTVENSENWVEKEHIDYWQACIDKPYLAVGLPSRITMIPDRVRQLRR